MAGTAQRLRRHWVWLRVVLALVAAWLLLGPPVPRASAFAEQADKSVPVGNLPGWHQVFRDDFTTDVPLGDFPGAVSDTWDAYSGFRNYADKGPGVYDPAKTVSISGGVMTIHLHTDGGDPLIAAPLPILPNRGTAYHGQTYGRYAVRFRADPIPGYKTAWLLWPDSDDWSDGEIDFPEGNLDDTIGGFVHHVGDPTTQDEYPTEATQGSWHTAVIEWTPTRITFYLDGSVVGLETDPGAIPHTSMHWVLQTETAAGVEPDESVTGDVQLDWMSIWSRD